MKKLMFGLLSLILVMTSANAQEDPAKLVKKAGRALSSYNLDPTNNGDKLEEAIAQINEATEAPAMASDYLAWQQKGEIYNTLANKDQSGLALAEIKKEHYKIKNFDAPITALKSFQKALTLAEKKYQTKDALKGIGESVRYLNMFANNRINSQERDYAGAYPLLDAVLDARETLLANGEKDVFESPEDLTQHQYVVAFTAKMAGDKVRAKELYKLLYEQGIDQADVYSSYFKILSEEGDPNAVKVLEKGRELYPDNSDILFAEINEYIKTEKYDLLEQKLKQAIDKEPDNPTIYSALGNVYMNLMQQEADAGNKEKSEEYFKKSLEYYNSALNLNPDLFDAVYSIGSVYFNEAVEIIKQQSKLGLSRDDQKKFDEMGKRVDELFSKALPYFQRAEKMNPNDRNTLIALKEIFARQNDFDKSNEFKRRLEVLDEGGTNANSYFKQ